MQTIHNVNKTISKIPLDLDNVLESMRVQLPSRIIFETCDSISGQKNESRKFDAEITIHNYIEGIKIDGNITGTSRGETLTTDFIVNQKSNQTSTGWDYCQGEEIRINVDLKLLNGQIIKLIEDHTVPIETRYKQLIFYS